jgi:hypothetical protein
VTHSQAANAYLTGSHCEPTQDEKQAFLSWLASQYNAIKADVRFTPSEVDPAQLKMRHANTGQILISTAHNESPWLDRASNAHFRAVHDWHHLQHGLGFDAEGEYAAYLVAINSAPKAIHWILRSEIYLQAAACIETGTFQPQRLVKTEC